MPFDPGERWGVEQVRVWPGRRGYRVRGTVDKMPFESVVLGRSRRFWVLVTDDMARAGKLEIGSKVAVSLLPAAQDPG